MFQADEAGLEKEKPTLESSAADGIVAVVAASDTTASVFSSLVWFLLSHPECYRRVQLELDSVFVDGDDPVDVSKHPQLEFLSACMSVLKSLFLLLAELIYQAETRRCAFIRRCLRMVPDKSIPTPREDILPERTRG